MAFMKGNREIYSTIIQVILTIFFSLFPIFFLPFFSNYYDTPKFLLLILTASFILLIWCFKVAVTGRISISFPRGIWGVLAMTVASLVSIFTITGSKTDSLISPLGLGLYLSLTLILIFASSFINPKIRYSIRWGFYSAVTILSVITIYQFFGLGKLLFPGIAFLSDSLWTPVGSAFSLITIYILAIPLSLGDYFLSRETKNELTLAFSVIIILLSAIGLGLTVYQLVPKLSTLVMPYQAGWSVLLEIFKNPGLAITGVGTGNYISAFTAARPAYLNLTPVWSVRFLSGPNSIFHYGTILGFLGIIGIVFMIKDLIPFKLFGRHNFYATALTVIIFSFLLFPAHIVIILLAFFILMQNPYFSDNYHIHARIPEHIRWLGWAVLGLGSVLTAILYYSLFSFIKGEYYFSRSLVAASQNNGSLLYDLQVRANTANQYMPAYRIAYSQTNLAIANALSGQVNQAENNEQNRQTISQLLQQAIREAKIATQLAPNNILAWENLARVYENIAPAVKDAEKWAIESYLVAIQLDPTNPFLRLNLATTYINQQNWDSALRQLETAAILKKDLPAIYYSIANIYKQNNQFLKQAEALSTTIKVLNPQSQDLATVTKELDDVKKKLTKEELDILEPKTPSESGSSINLPSPAKTLPLEPKLEIPEASPPAIYKTSTSSSDFAP